MSKPSEHQYPENAREEALERLLEATLESETRGTPELQEAVVFNKDQPLSLLDHKKPERPSFASIASAAGLVIALCALGVVLFSASIFDKPSDPQVADGGDRSEEGTDEQEAGEEPERSDSTPDYAPISYQEVMKEGAPAPKVYTLAELETLIAEVPETKALQLVGENVNAGILKRAVAAFPNLDDLRIVYTSLENEDLDVLLKLEKVRKLSFSRNGRLTDPFVFQQSLLELFPEDLDGRVLIKLRERKAWCQKLTHYATDRVFAWERGNKKDVITRLGSDFLRNYFKNVQSLSASARTLTRFLLDKPSDNVSELHHIIPNLKHLTLIGMYSGTDEMKNLALAIRRRSFLDGKDGDLSARLELESLVFDRRSTGGGRLDKRGVGFFSDGKIFLRSKLKMFKALDCSNGENSRLLSAPFRSLEHFEVRDGYIETSEFVGVLAEARRIRKPLPLKKLILAGSNFDQESAKALIDAAPLLPNLRELDLQDTGLPIPSARELRDALPKCRVTHPQGRSFDENFLRAMPFLTNTQRGDTRRFSVSRETYLFAEDLNTNVVHRLRHLSSPTSKSEFGALFAKAALPKKFRFDVPTAVFDSMPLAAGKYALRGLSSHLEIPAQSFEADGKTRQELIYEVKRLPSMRKGVITKFLKVQVSGIKASVVPAMAVMQNEFPLLVNLALTRAKDGDFVTEGGTFKFSASTTLPLEYTLLVVVDGYPVYRTTYDPSKPFRKRIKWEGKAWQVSEITG